MQLIDDRMIILMSLHLREEGPREENGCGQGGVEAGGEVTCGVQHGVGAVGDDHACPASRHPHCVHQGKALLLPHVLLGNVISQVDLGTRPTERLNFRVSNEAKRKKIQIDEGVHSVISILHSRAAGDSCGCVHLTVHPADGLDGGGEGGAGPHPAQHALHRRAAQLERIAALCARVELVDGAARAEKHYRHRGEEKSNRWLVLYNIVFILECSVYFSTENQTSQGRVAGLTISVTDPPPQPTAPPRGFVPGQQVGGGSDVQYKVTAVVIWSHRVAAAPPAAASPACTLNIAANDQIAANWRQDGCSLVVSFRGRPAVQTTPLISLTLPAAHHLLHLLSVSCLWPAD